MRGNKLTNEIWSDGEFYSKRIGVSHEHLKKQQGIWLPSRVKSNNGGMSFPLAILASGTRRSSKKGCVIASIAVSRAEGVYSSNLEIKSIASGGVRGRNTFENKENNQFCPIKVEQSDDSLTFENG
jgi:hypothetical protein